MSNLKECPFCGGTAKSYVYDQMDSWHLLGVVECLSCSVRIEENSVNFNKFDSINDAEKAADIKVSEIWNTRVETERDALQESEKLLMKFINDAYKSATGKPSKKTAIEMMRYVSNRPKLQQLVNNCDRKGIKKYRSCEKLEGEG